ncbi:hypothetical protein UFOVP1197_62 [uncultured Caudovirales phage]|uniref:Uncharacterized protein n=2 Tax=uncultured Caudovirales phage TaxID=2100421 RepID=A0A6J5RDQ4_9CAUD|nr:hypothetical protein UFOVP659_74 [uncultured Caudovirales phage]CAB4169528.1 hypothetical protein UFOVP885_53 [uncultured Caudovirales phage]CAB4190448.1 hypothetical protein UFOVP1197_62 [uncultured Caudovirales phage]CAB4195630.1 hypothetical protein UFOVP1294_28 [uncultured Caudovirales phage]CAB4210600.1 hypothetical protein UFOVP1412_31 [uncultured Caudovirales phage]
MTNLLVTAAMIASVVSFDKKGEDFRIATAKLCEDLLAQGVSPEHFKRPAGAEKQNNLHVVNFFGLSELAVRTIKVKGKKATDETIKKFLDPEVSSAAMLQGTPKGGVGTSWNSQVSSKLGQWRDKLNAHIAAKAAPSTVTKKVLSDVESAMKTIQQQYGKTQKAAFKCHDADAYKKALHLAAFAVTGKEGQIKTGDKTKK